MVAGLNRRWLVGLVGTEEAKHGRSKASQLRLFFFGTFGDESGGVTGALFEIRRGGSDDGIELLRKAKGLFNGGSVESRCDGLGKDEDERLHWYEGNDDDGGLGFREEHGVVFVDEPPCSKAEGGGLHPCNFG